MGLRYNPRNIKMIVDRAFYAGVAALNSDKGNELSSEPAEIWVL